MRVKIGSVRVGFPGETVASAVVTAASALVDAAADQSRDLDKLPALAAAHGGGGVECTAYSEAYTADSKSP